MLKKDFFYFEHFRDCAINCNINEKWWKYEIKYINLIAVMVLSFGIQNISERERERGGGGGWMNEIWKAL